MKYFSIVTISILLFSCQSYRQKVNREKQRFINLAARHAHGPETGGIRSIGETFSASQHLDERSEMRSLDIDTIITILGDSGTKDSKMDSMVILSSGKYRVVYDFAALEREISAGLIQYFSLEKIDQRLYFGRSVQ